LRQIARSTRRARGPKNSGPNPHPIKLDVTDHAAVHVHGDDPRRTRRNRNAVTEIQPGSTKTNIITRYRGDKAKEKAWFDQFKMALEPADVAACILFALNQPPHVQIAELMVLPANRY
jgi:3-hydroxy acid dehydrogenase/malonic semialdehyde reductase